MPYITLVMATGGWAALFQLFNRSGVMNPAIRHWFPLMGIGASIVVAGALIRIFTDSNALNSLGSIMSIAGSWLEFGPLLVGTATGGRRRGGRRQE